MHRFEHMIGCIERRGKQLMHVRAAKSTMESERWPRFARFRRGLLRAKVLASASVGLPLLIAAGLSVSGALAGALPPGVREIDVTNDTTRRWGEPQIAVNPRNPKNIVYTIVGLAFTNYCLEVREYDAASPCASRKLPNGGSRNIGLGDNVPSFTVVGVWVTFDGGVTWKRSANVPGEISTFPRDHKAHKARTESGDPMVTVGPDGSFYLGWDAIHYSDSLTTIVDYGGIAVSKSTDGGLTWGPTVLPGTRLDRPMITADLSTGAIYEASSGTLGPLSTGDISVPETGPNTRHLTMSKDGVNWTTPQPMGGSGTSMSAAYGVLANVFTTTAENTLFGDANNELCGGAPKPCVLFQTTDQGATWSRHVVPETEVAVTGRPIVAADPTKPGHFTVALLTRSTGELHVYRTSDSGSTWSGPTVVSDDATKSHYQPSMAYGPKGDLVMLWKSRNAPAQAPPAAPPPGSGLPRMDVLAPYNLFAVRSKNGGATFSHPLKLNSVQSPAPDPRANAGDDLTYVAVTEEHAYLAYASWASSERAGFLSIAKLSAFK
jgi:hypothetical protein